jgi:hypothetical protein
MPLVDVGYLTGTTSATKRAVANTNSSTTNQKTKLDNHVNDQDELIGCVSEYASVLEKKLFDFVLFEIFEPKRYSKDH